MKSKVVREIPANPFLREARKLKKNLRVAAYCRVSTEEEEQQSSFEIQVEYYTKLLLMIIGLWQEFLRMTGFLACM